MARPGWIDADELARRERPEWWFDTRGYLNFTEAERLAAGRPFEHQSDGSTLIFVGGHDVEP